MPKIETVERFIAAVESNDHVQAMEAFYLPDASIQENLSAPRVGKETLVANETRVLARAKTVVSKCIRPYFIQDDRVVIRWHFYFEWKDGTYSDIHEITWQEWQGEKIYKEQFFYDPEQMIPKNKAE